MKKNGNRLDSIRLYSLFQVFVLSDLHVTHLQNHWEHFARSQHDGKMKQDVLTRELKRQRVARPQVVDVSNVSPREEEWKHPIQALFKPIVTSTFFLFKTWNSFVLNPRCRRSEIIKAPVAFQIQTERTRRFPLMFILFYKVSPWDFFTFISAEQK